MFSIECYDQQIKEGTIERKNSINNNCQCNVRKTLSVLEHDQVDMGNAVSSDEGESLFAPSMTADHLPDDVLFLIFEILPLRDRLNIERVSTRWLELSRLLWSRTKELNMIKQDFPCSHLYDFRPSPPTWTWPGVKRKAPERVADAFIKLLQLMRNKTSGITSLKLVCGCF